MTLLVKAAAAGLAGSVMALMLRRSAPELGFLLGTAVSLLAAGLALELITELLELVSELRDETGLSPAVTGPVMKCVGVGIVTRLSADLCRDAGQSAPASAVELCGAACAMAAAMPLIRSLLRMINDMV